ncbi:helix-turn-helix transcriptional regulator [Lacisediminihabitans profunda]|uniref:Transcriptional regulator n=1 Tax=Lacisediminihabitans profunda TaxID=2594790 RepID=A0A5C8UJK8_9MICO|nr:helix-turn-helix transcriptional regulator [Lacisediminihabitans profunda]TXN28368.1 transcriptional regulator [Lacisediminihabitans profunda]
MHSRDAGTVGAFLAASRARVIPDAGEERGPLRRRVPGLRREEIAILAGVSASYYTRLEQGQAANASPQVLDALARALRLGDVERDHLHNLARAATRPLPFADPPEEQASAGFREILTGLQDTAAMVLGRRRDILAWNRAGHALFAPHLDPADVDDSERRPNATEMIFLDPHMREFYLDWEEKAIASVGHLRVLSARFPTDARLLALIGRLSVSSDDFVRIWAGQSIRTSSSATYRVRHPVAGELALRQQLLTSAETPGQSIVICTAVEGTSSQHALALLGRMTQSGFAL